MNRFICLIVFVFSLLASASDWPQWRGPLGNGVCTELDLPLAWNAKDGTNIRWKVPLPKTDQSQSSPIVWKDKIFVITAINNPLAQHVTCFQKSDGKQLWEKEIPPGPWILKDLRGGYTCSTPCTDGERVYAFFGSSVLVALDFAGEIVWSKPVEPRNFDVAIATSPIIYKDTVILFCDQNGKTSFVRAYDRKTGETKWETKRPDVVFNHSTPLLTEVNGKPQLLVASSGALQGVSPDDGSVIWFAKGKGDIGTPVFANGLAYMDDGRGGTGICVDATGTGDQTSKIKWSFKTMVEGFNSPIIVDGRLYRLFNDLKCFDLATGKPVYSERMGARAIQASPFATPDGRIYYASAGTTNVVKAGEKYELLATNELGDSSSASAAVSDGVIIFKGAKNLFCVGKK